MRGRREADDKEARVRIAKSGNRPAPIIPVTKLALLRLGHMLPITDKSWASATDDDRPRESAQVGNGRHTADGTMSASEED